MPLLQRLFGSRSSASTSTSTAAPRSWRGLQRPTRRAPASEPARRHHWQRILRLWLGLLGAGASVIAVGYGIYFVREQAERVEARTPSAMLREIQFSSDGVLTADWAREILGDPVGQPMSSISLATVRAALEQHRQIARAQVALQFPDRLMVTIEERVPLLRARILGADGQPEDILFARDGVAFKGWGYPETMVRNLPSLGGVRLQRNATGLVPVEGLDTVDALLKAARELVPDLVADWRTVSLERFRDNPDAPGSLLVVRGRMIPEIVFEPRNFPEQLAQLSRIVVYANQAGRREFQRIDLSFGDQAYVTWQPSPGLPGSPRRTR